jgi:hypothetical protein
VLNFFFGVVTTLILREFWDWLPALGRMLIRRAAKKLPKEHADIPPRWLETAAKLPGGNLTKLLWAVACMRMAAQMQKGTIRFLRCIFLFAFLRQVAGEFFRLRFASPRQLAIRWFAYNLFFNQALAANDPNARQPLLELAERVGDEDTKQKLRVMVEAMKISATDPPVPPPADQPNSSLGIYWLF